MKISVPVLLLSIAFQSSRFIVDMPNLDLLLILKSFLEFPWELNYRKSDLQYFDHAFCFLKCPYSTKLCLLFTRFLTVSTTFTPKPQSFAISVDIKMKVVLAWKGVFKGEARNSFICSLITHSLSLSHSLSHHLVIKHLKLTLIPALYKCLVQGHLVRSISKIIFGINM